MLSTTRPIAVVWAVLVVATIVSWSVGAEEGVSPTAVASAAVLALAYLKVWLVGLYFMELRVAPVALRAIFELWVVLSLGGLILVYIVVA